MGWQDRPYYRDRPSGMGGPLMWLFTGSVSLGTWFGIHVRVHAQLLLFAVLTALLPGSIIGGVYGSLSFLFALFVIVLLHEFGHCFASRSVGGDPAEIVLTPLGGLALADAPRRPWATFWTVLGGPLVNVLICVVCALVLLVMGGGLGVLHALPWNLFHVSRDSYYQLGDLLSRSRIAWWTWWTFTVSWALLMFNLLPIFPLDGGQLLQSLLWVRFGYYKSMKFATTTGLVGAAFLALLGLGTGQFLLILIAVMGIMTCLQLRAQNEATGPEEDWQSSVDYSASARARPKHDKGPGKLAQRRASARRRPRRRSRSRSTGSSRRSTARA